MAALVYKKHDSVYILRIDGVIALSREVSPTSARYFKGGLIYSNIYEECYRN